MEPLERVHFQEIIERFPEGLEDHAEMIFVVERLLVSDNAFPIFRVILVDSLDD